MILLKQKEVKREAEPSIIRIIQDMVRRGESESDIMETLRGLGVEEGKAKKLLMLGQADTFALVESEVSKIVKGTLAEEEESFQDALKAKLEDAIAGARSELESGVRNYTDQKTEKILEMMEEIRQRNEESIERARAMETEMRDVRLRSGAGQGKIITTALIVFGVLFLLFDAYLFYTAFQSALTIDQIVLNIVVAVVGMAMLFTASIV